MISARLVGIGSLEPLTTGTRIGDTWTFHEYGSPMPPEFRSPGATVGVPESAQAVPAALAADPRDAIRSSARVLLTEHRGRLMEACYQRLIALVPGILQNPGDHGRLTAAELVREVLGVAVSDAPVEVVTPRLMATGGRLFEQGIPADGYPRVTHTLLRAARDIQAPEDGAGASWIAYLDWAGEHLAQGADDARARGAQMPSRRSATTADPTTLGEIVQLLDREAFSGNSRGLASVLTRVALRTGVDLREPRPDQERDPAVVAAALATLASMGYQLGAERAEGPADPPHPTGPAAPEDANLFRDNGSAPVRDPSRPRPGPAHAARSGPYDPGRRPRSRLARWWYRLLHPAGSPSDDPPATVASLAAAPQTLTEILERLRTGDLVGNDWALDSVVTRVALRTGIDIRSPRQDQLADPDVVRQVLSVLGSMGYTVRTEIE